MAKDVVDTGQLPVGIYCCPFFPTIGRFRSNTAQCDVEYFCQCLYQQVKNLFAIFSAYSWFCGKGLCKKLNKCNTCKSLKGQTYDTVLWIKSATIIWFLCSTEFNMYKGVMTYSSVQHCRLYGMVHLVLWCLLLEYVSAVSVIR